MYYASASALPHAAVRLGGGRGEPWLVRRGDRIGCGVQVVRAAPTTTAGSGGSARQELDVFFTHNGAEVTCKHVALPRDALWPCVALCSGGEDVKLWY